MGMSQEHQDQDVKLDDTGPRDSGSTGPSSVPERRLSRISSAMLDVAREHEEALPGDTMIIVSGQQDGDGALALGGYAGSAAEITWQILQDVMAEVVLLFRSCGVQLVLKNGWNGSDAAALVEEAEQAAGAKPDQVEAWLDDGGETPERRVLDILHYLINRDDELSALRTVVLLSQPAPPDEELEEGAKIRWTGRTQILQNGFADTQEMITESMQTLLRLAMHGNGRLVVLPVVTSA
jgi:hypothetical protein